MSEPVTLPTSVYALLADGRTVQIRPAAAADFAAVKAMHDAMSPSNVYLRFFSLSRTAAEHEARRVTRVPQSIACTSTLRPSFFSNSPMTSACVCTTG